MVRAILLAACLVIASAAPAQRVVGFAKLHAHTLEAGPTSGRFIRPPRGIQTPFHGRQPVQGFSAIVRGGPDTLVVMSDNGFGARENSPDHVLRLFEIKADFAGGDVQVLRSIRLRDPDGLVPFPIVAERTHYPDRAIPVDPTIRRDRLLTGWDFDPESCQRGDDATFWIGDEFGPFLLHVDAQGRVLEPPFALPGVHSPQNPLEDEEGANLPASGGFEGLARAGTVLHPLLEKTLQGEPPGELNIYRFDLDARSYDPPTPYRVLLLDDSGHRIGDFVALDETRFLVIERDDFQGREARFKKIFLVDFAITDDRGRLKKREIVDLLRIPDPDRLASEDAVYSMPFVTLEGLLVFDERTLCVLNDNNYPFSVGRHVDTGAPDDNEIVLIGFENPLSQLRIGGE